MELKLSRDCWPCRTRHVRCDQSRVPCGKCVRSGRNCSQERPIRWVKGVAIRGRMQGLAYEAPPAKQLVSGGKNAKRIVFKDPATVPKTRPAARAAKTGRDMAVRPRGNVLNVEYDGAMAGHWLLPPVPALQDNSAPSLDSVTRYYFDYYENICEDFVLSQMDKRQLKSLVSLALEDQVLRMSLLALASRHLANRGQLFCQQGTSGSAKADRDALVFKHHAIQALSDALRTPAELGKDTTIAGAFIFILLDLLESGGSGWHHHLEGAKGLFGLVQQEMEAAPPRSYTPPLIKQDLRSFLFRKIFLAECLGSALSHTGCTTSPSAQFSLDEHDMARESMEDSFLGCPELLLKAIRFISTERDIIAASAQKMHHGDRSAHEARLVAILDLVESFLFHKSPFHPKDEGPSARQDHQGMQRLQLLSEVYKLGTLIYGKRVLSALTESGTSLEKHVSSLLELLNTMRDDRESLKCVLWPLFIAGLECRSPAQRQHFITHLEEFWMTTKCLNAVNAAQILRDHWRRSEAGDTSWPFDSGRFGRLWLLM